MSWVIYGIRPVEELLQSQSREIRQILVSRERGLQELITAAQEQSVSIRRTPVDEIDAICGGARKNHQGIAALVGEYPYATLEQVSEKNGKTPLVLVADGITDPQNLGAMLRSALVLGATGVVLPKNRSAVINPTVVRVSAGATEHLRCAQVTNLRNALEQLKAAGLWIAGAVAKGGTAPQDTDLTVPLALVLGNEARGIRPLVAKNCDLKLTIPAAAGVACLNVAAATAALFYEASRQRSAMPA